MRFPLRIPAPYLMPWMLRALRLRLPEAVWKIDSMSNQVALTFDDGPSRFTPELLQVLKEEQVPATFFVVGNRVERHPGIVRQAQREGHLIALHTEHHRNVKQFSENELRQDLARCQGILRQVLNLSGEPSRWCFRPPYGSCRAATIRILASENVDTIMFGIVPGEQLMPRGWRELPEKTCHRILREVQGGSIIALHDGEFVQERDKIFDCPRVAETARMLIRQLKAAGFGFSTV